MKLSMNAGAKTGTAIAALLLCLLLPLALISCSSLPWQSTEPEVTKPVDAVEKLEQLNLRRNPNRVSLLLAVGGNEAGSLSAVDLIVLDDSGEAAVNVLQLPTNLYTRSGGTLSGYFSNIYRLSTADGQDSQSAVEKAMDSLKGVVQNYLALTVDYTVYLSRDGLRKAVDTVGGITLDLAYPISVGGHSLSAGKQVIGGSDVAVLYDYGNFSESFSQNLNLSKQIFTGVIGSLKSNIDKNILALCTLDLRDAMTTDIPTTGGSDVFIVRKLRETSFDRLRYTVLSSNAVTLESGPCRVICKEGAIGQIADFAGIYKEPLGENEFDPGQFFVNPTDSVSMAIYGGSPVEEAVVTGDSVRTGKIS